MTWRSNTVTSVYVALLTFVGVLALVGLSKAISEGETRKTYSEDEELRRSVNEVSREEVLMDYRYIVKEIEVIDGDTVRCLIDLGFDTYKRVDVRITGIDTPEARGHEKVAGIPVAKVVEKYIARFKPEELRVISVSWGKYARRCIGDIIPVNEALAPRLSHYLQAEGLTHAYGSDPYTEAELEEILERAERILE